LRKPIEKIVIGFRALLFSSKVGGWTIRSFDYFAAVTKTKTQTERQGT